MTGCAAGCTCKQEIDAMLTDYAIALSEGRPIPRRPIPHPVLPGWGDHWAAEGVDRFMVDSTRMLRLTVRARGTHERCYVYYTF